jgi:hypothetical protein
VEFFKLSAKRPRAVWRNLEARNKEKIKKRPSDQIFLLFFLTLVIPLRSVTLQP